MMRDDEGHYILSWVCRDPFMLLTIISLSLSHANLVTIQFTLIVGRGFFVFVKGFHYQQTRGREETRKRRSPKAREEEQARRKKMWLWMTSFTLFFIPHVFFPYSQPFGIFIQKKKKKKTPTAFLVIIMNSSFPRDVEKNSYRPSVKKLFTVCLLLRKKKGKNNVGRNLLNHMMKRY